MIVVLVRVMIVYGGSWLLLICGWVSMPFVSDKIVFNLLAPYELVWLLYLVSRKKLQHLSSIEQS